MNDEVKDFDLGQDGEMMRQTVRNTASSSLQIPSPVLYIDESDRVFVPAEVNNDGAAQHDDLMPSPRSASSELLLDARSTSAPMTNKTRNKSNAKYVQKKTKKPLSKQKEKRVNIYHRGRSKKHGPGVGGTGVGGGAGSKALGSNMSGGSSSTSALFMLRARRPVHIDRGVDIYASSSETDFDARFGRSPEPRSYRRYGGGVGGDGDGGDEDFDSNSDSNSESGDDDDDDDESDGYDDEYDYDEEEEYNETYGDSSVYTFQAIVDALAKKSTKRLTGAYVATTLRLHSLRKALEHRFRWMPPGCSLVRRRELLEAHLPGDRHLFAFKFGIVVMWGFDMRAERSWVAELRQYATERRQFAPRSAADVNDFCTFGYGRQPQIVNDHFVLRKHAAAKHIEHRHQNVKLAISYAIAQNCKLSVFESVLEDNVDDVQDMVGAIVNTSLVAQRSRPRVVKRLGELYSMRLAINLASDVVDTPKIVWDNPKLEPFYEAAREYMSVETRVEQINARLSLLHELYDQANNELIHQHSTRLEWIVIILVLLEGVFELISVFIELYGVGVL
jgi:uncharacterized Rmd1/YagE family protein